MLNPGLASPAPQEKQEPKTTIVPSTGWSALNLKQLWLYRDLLMTLARRDITLRYRQTALGIVWVILQPLLGAGILSFVFGTIGKFASDGLPYIVFSYAGMLAWNLYSSTLNKASLSLIQNANLISKVFFPRLILPVSTIFGTLLDFAIAFVVLLILLVIYGIMPGLAILTFPLWLLLTLMFALGLGLFASALTVSYRDVQFILPVALQMLFYASPVAYTTSSVPAHLRIYFYLNPLTGLLEAFRWSLLGRGQVNGGSLAYSAVVSILCFGLGALAFKKMERKFADVI